MGIGLDTVMSRAIVRQECPERQIGSKIFLAACRYCMARQSRNTSCFEFHAFQSAGTVGAAGFASGGHHPFFAAALTPGGGDDSFPPAANAARK